LRLSHLLGTVGVACIVAVTQIPRIGRMDRVIRAGTLRAALRSLSHAALSAEAGMVKATSGGACSSWLLVAPQRRPGDRLALRGVADLAIELATGRWALPEGEGAGVRITGAAGSWTAR
jgi:hypothetical protein